MGGAIPSGQVVSIGADSRSWAGFHLIKPVQGHVQRVLKAYSCADLSDDRSGAESETPEVGNRARSIVLQDYLPGLGVQRKDVLGNQSAATLRITEWHG